MEAEGTGKKQNVPLILQRKSQNALVEIGHAELPPWHRERPDVHTS
jgi:hypothetical protein